jgi:hypothetical protein
LNEGRRSHAAARDLSTLVYNSPRTRPHRITRVEMPPRGMSAEVRTVDDRRASRPPSPVPFRGKTGGCPDWTRSHTSHRAPIALTDPHPSPSTHAGQA